MVLISLERTNLVVRLYLLKGTLHGTGTAGLLLSWCVLLSAAPPLVFPQPILSQPAASPGWL